MDKYIFFIILAVLVVLASFGLFGGAPELPEPTPEPTLSQIGIILAPTRTPEPTPETRLVRPDKFSVNVHLSPEIEAPVIGWVFGGFPIIVLSCRSGWAYITTPDLIGWINGTCLEPNPCGEAGSCQ